MTDCYFSLLTGCKGVSARGSLGRQSNLGLDPLILSKPKPLSVTFGNRFKREFSHQ